MTENLYETLHKLSSLLHYLGKYDESNAIAWLSGELKKNNIQKVQDLDYVEIKRKIIK